MAYLVSLTLFLLMVVFGVVIRRQTRDRILATPFFALFAMELITIWPTMIVAYISRASTDAYLYLLVLGTTLFLFGGYLAGAAAFKIDRAAAHHFHARPIVPPPPGSLAAIWLISFAILLGASLYAANGIPPLWKALLAGPSEMIATMVRESRLEATKGHYFGGEYRGQGIVKTLMLVGPSFLVAAAGFGLVLKPSRLRLALFLGSIGLGILFAMSIGSRGPAVNVVLSSLTVSALLWRLRVRHLIAALLVFLAATIFISAAMPRYYSSFVEGGLSYLPDSVAAVVERVSVGNASNSVLAVEAGRVGLLGRNLGEEHLDTLVRFLPNSAGGLPLAADLTMLRRGNVNTTTFTTPTWLAATYLDFGLFGSMVAFLILGVGVAFAERWMFGQRKTVIAVSLAGVLTLGIAMATVTSPLSMIPLGVVLAGYGVMCAVIVRLAAALHRSLQTGNGYAEFRLARRLGGLGDRSGGFATADRDR
jgi:oligosaccharide repeat unit polymerase